MLRRNDVISKTTNEQKLFSAFPQSTFKSFFSLGPRGESSPLSAHLRSSSHLLQQVVVDVAPGGIAVEVEVDVHVLAEAAGVVVAICLGVPEGFQHTVGLEQHILHTDLSRWGKQ